MTHVWCIKSPHAGLGHLPKHPFLKHTQHTPWKALSSVSKYTGGGLIVSCKKLEGGILALSAEHPILIAKECAKGGVKYFEDMYIPLRLPLGCYQDILGNAS